MLNQVILVGRLVQTPEIKVIDSGSKLSRITLAVPRSYKNINGEYETDFIDCTLWQGIAENTATYCKRGDIVGIKGRIETRKYENDNGKKFYTDVVAEKVTFLSSNNDNKTHENEEG